ncbi:MAG TPA: PaaI family thioesterase [Solirubrobacterales bacterium]
MSENLPETLGFAELVGISWLDDDPEHARARVDVRAELLQPFGLMHGGVFATLVESVCSRSTALNVLDGGMGAMGQTINVNFVRPVLEGWAEVRARARHRGRTTWVWEAEVLDAEERVCALAQMTIAVRPIRRSDS